MLKLVSINLLLFLTMLLMAEWGWRSLVSEGDRQQQEVAFINTSLTYLAPCARELNRGGVDYLVRNRSLGEAYSWEYPAKKKTETKRIAVVGESSGANLAFYMQEVIANSGLQDTVELMHCAVPGSALDHVQLRTNELLEYDLDVLVVVFGHNVDFHYTTDRTWLSLSRWRSKSRLISGLSRFFSNLGSGSKAASAQRLLEFEKWLREVAVETRRRGVKTVLNTLPSNLWMPPYRDVEARGDQDYLTAFWSWTRGRHIEAVERLKRITRVGGRPYWHFQLGVWLARLGRVEEARRELQRVVDIDVVPVPAPGIAPVGRDRAPSQVNEILRRVAIDEGVDLRDTAHLVELKVVDQITGWQVMADHCHLQSRFVREEAKGILAAVLNVPVEKLRGQLSNHDRSDSDNMLRFWNQLGLIVTSIAWDDGAAEALAYAVESALREDPESAKAAIENFLNDDLPSRVSDPRRRFALFTGIAWGYWNAGHREEAKSVNARARQGSLPTPWVQVGLFSVSEGNRDGARKAFRRALVIDPTRAEARHFLSLLTS